MKKFTYVLLAALFMSACSTSTSNEESATEETTDASKPVSVKMDIVGKPVSYSADSVNMNGYIAEDASNTSKKPGILVVHEWWGHNEHARQKAEGLAKLGYVALAVDMYGDGKQAAHPGEAGEFAGMVMSNMGEAQKRFDAAIETLKNHPSVDADKIGAIGFCFGGSVVLSMANAGYDLDAVAAFHAGLQLPVMPETGAVKAKILVANGADDPMISEQHVTDYKAVMDAAGADYKYVSYDGAVHAYTNKEADAMAEKFEPLKGAIAYNAAADSASWEEMKILFASAF